MELYKGNQWKVPYLWFKSVNYFFFYKYIFGTPGREDEESVAEKHDLQEISHIVIFSFTNDHWYTKTKDTNNHDEAVKAALILNNSIAVHILYLEFSYICIIHLLLGNYDRDTSLSNYLVFCVS